MSSYAGDRTLERGQLSRSLERLLAVEIPTSLEFWLYTGLIVAAVLFRFVDLGARALHHDESLHATYSWYLAQGRGYTHDPLMHGPFLFHITALSFVLFGASDAAARFPVALLGSIAVIMPLLLRPWLGKIGAFAAAAFIAFSPSILYYSRFIRDDPFVILFTLAMVVSIFRYRQSRHEGWLYLGAASLLIGFTSLEVEFIIAAIVLLYLEGSLSQAFLQRLDAHHNLSPAARAGLFLGLLPTAWLLALAWPFCERQRERWGLDEDLPADGDLLVLFGLLTAPQFSAAIKVVLKKFHYDLTAGTGYQLFGHLLTRTEAVGALTVITLLTLTFVLGLYWSPRRWLIAAALFYIPYFLLYTTFLTNKAGWGSGIWGSLSYWLDQQDVRRGTQPVFYFAMTLSTYEYLALGLAAAGLLIHAWRRGYDALVLFGSSIALIVVAVFVNGRWGNVATIPFVLLALLLITAAMEGDPLRRFLVFYGGAIFWGLSVAGEKMPWLTEHPALPLALLAALTVNDMLGLLPALRDRSSARLWAVVAAVGAAGAGAALLTATHSAGLRLLGLALLLAALALGALLLARGLDPALRRRWLPASGAVAAALFVGFFGLLTLRNDWRLNFIHPDTPDEMLIYTQTSPDIPKIARQIDDYALASGKGRNLQITVDVTSSFTWPWAWYLRDYPRVSWVDFSIYNNNPGGLTQASLGDVVIVHHNNQQTMTPVAANFAPPEMIHHRSWFPEGWTIQPTVAGQTPIAAGYRATTTKRVVNGVKDGSLFDRWWTYVTHRDGIAVVPSSVTQYPANELPVGQCNAYSSIDEAGRPCLGSEDADVYFPAGYKPSAGLSLAPPLNNAATSAATASGAVAAGGARATSAAGDAAPRTQGQTLAFGAPGSIPGALSRPAGIAVDAQGNVYIADSKNDRVSKYDADGRFLAASARLSTAAAVGGGQLPEAWGVAVDGGGNVYVADTWNDRIVKLDPSLKTLASFGSPATDVSNPGPGQLYGPRGIAVDADGNIRVADTGDARIVTYSPDGQLLGVNGSRGSAPGQFQEPTDIAVLPNGGYAVADAWNNRVQIFDKSFTPIANFTIAWTNGPTGQDGENKPYLAALPDGTLLVTQPRAGLAQIYDSSGKLLRTLPRLPGMTAAFRQPLGVAATADGAIYVVDGLNDEVDRVPNADLTGSPQG